MPSAVQISRFGGPEVLELVDVPLPQPATSQVRVRVRTAGVNPADTKLRAGARPGLPLPATLGTDLAGTIDAVGSAASTFRVGDDVLGSAPMAAYAQYAVADVRDLMPKPAELSWEIVGSLAVVATTAYRLLIQLAVSDGETLLIHGASGGVGLMATQLARLKGARVLGTAHATNDPLLRAAGAEPVRYGPGLAERLRAAAPGGVDAVLDASGRGELPISITLAGGPDRVITIAASDAKRYGVRFSSGVGEVDTSRALPETLAALRDGDLTFPIWRTYLLTEVAAAHRASETRHPPGKIVLTVDPRATSAPASRSSTDGTPGAFPCDGAWVRGVTRVG